MKMKVPIQYNPSTKEHYIRLPPPHSNLIITPSRPTDGPSSVKLLNSPPIYQNLTGPPFPYTQQSWEEWWPIISSSNNKALEEFLAVEEARKKGEDEDKDGKLGKAWVGSGQPFNVIRDVGDGIGAGDGSEGIFGEISIRRSDFADLKGEEKEKAKEKNNGLEAGNPDIEWDMGFYLSPEGHGKGIIPLALRTLIESFYIPYMNVHNLTGTFFDTNAASRRVFEKTGFVFQKVIPDIEELSEAKTGVKGKMVGIGFMKWKP